MHQQDHLLSCQLCPTFPPIVEGMQLMELQGSKRISFAKCREWFGMNLQLQLPGSSQPIRDFPAIESMTF